MTRNYYVGVDIGGTKIGVSTFDVASSSVIDVERFSSGATCDPGEAIARVVDISRRWIANRGHSPAAIGVSVGGMYDVPSGCMRHAPHLPLWDGFPIVSTIRQALHVPVFAENDANACALAEWQYGAGRGCNHLLFLTFGTGLGGGLIMNGQLYRGACGLAGEVGQIRVADEGPGLRGKPGCLEGFGSGAGIALVAAAARRETSNSSLPAEPTAKDVAEAASQGDELALSVVQECGNRVGRGLAMLIDVLNPERIILGSIFARCEALLRPAIEASIADEAMDQTRGACTIVAAQLGEAIGDFGAATVAGLGSVGSLNPAAPPVEERPPR